LRGGEGGLQGGGGTSKRGAGNGVVVEGGSSRHGGRWENAGGIYAPCLVRGEVETRRVSTSQHLHTLFPYRGMQGRGRRQQSCKYQTKGQCWEEGKVSKGAEFGGTYNKRLQSAATWTRWKCWGTCHRGCRLICRAGFWGDREKGKGRIPTITQERSAGTSLKM